MLIPSFGSMLATNLAFGSAGNVQGLNQSRLGLANTVTGDESQDQIASMQAVDKAVTLQGLSSQTNYQVAQALQDSAGNLKKKHADQRQNELGGGVIFG